MLSIRRDDTSTSVDTTTMTNIDDIAARMGKAVVPDPGEMLRKTTYSLPSNHDLYYTYRQVVTGIGNLSPFKNCLTE